MGFWSSLRDRLRAAVEPKPISTRLTEAEALEAARPAIDARGGVHPDERVWASVETESGRVIWAVKVQHREAAKGAHLHVRIDDATGDIVRVFEVPY
jgi:hypothetical protein